MKAVIDTNVIAYFLLHSPDHLAETSEFWAGLREPLAPALWEAELANVIWMSARAGVLSAAEGSRKLDLARRLGIFTVPARSLWQGALLRAVQSGVAVYVW